MFDDVWKDVLKKLNAMWFILHEIISRDLAKGQSPEREMTVGAPLCKQQNCLELELPICFYA